MNWEREVCMRINLERLFRRHGARAAVVAAIEAQYDVTPRENTADLADTHLSFTTRDREGAEGLEDHPSRWIATFLTAQAKLVLPGPDGSRVKADLCFRFAGVGEGAPACLVTTQQKIAHLPNGPFVPAHLVCTTCQFETLDDEPGPVHAWDVMAMVLDSVEENSGGTVFVLDEEIGRLPENEHFLVRPSYEHGECFACRACGKPYACWAMEPDVYEAGCPACREARNRQPTGRGLARTYVLSARGAWTPCCPRPSRVLRATQEKPTGSASPRDPQDGKLSPGLPDAIRAASMEHHRTDGCAGVSEEDIRFREDFSNR